MKILAAIDSFKGSMTSEKANQSVKDALPQHDVITFPIADGGEGTVDAFVGVMNGEVKKATITGVNGDAYIGQWGWVEQEKTAVIEVAEGAGLIQANKETLHPKNHTSYGVGEQITQALNQGASTIILGLGGSATTDGGLGLLQALGVVFKDAQNKELKKLPVKLGQVHSIDASGLDERVKKVNWLLASDVSNPLLGEKGAVHVFGEQKGLSKDELSTYDKNMSEFSNLVIKETGKDQRFTEGAGAAGGIGYAALSFFPCEFQSGLSLLAEKGNLEQFIQDVDLVITGEGKFDDQSLGGKVPIGISRLAKKHSVPALLFAGKIDSDRTAIEEENLHALIPIVDAPMTLSEAMENGQPLLLKAVKRSMHLIDLIGKIKGMKA
ncbi:MAG: glycerate kinase [Alkalibacterium sp.]|uniref:Glycerate kinase n=1 Tax=Alkalibacterium gilvum TaxID=1130080 RepID=A0A1H6SVV7_9LACT|nr:MULTISPECIES: glycerate kinase [Alkalibacterium]MDN6294129.1 glycerate kinase [Alkalibacterium sp.]MDN6295896.1 glycerate kinase [Alkalibacterium sp.]MDN6326601.1 glycerate kinase [Alkalibacterium sp.]SEI71871.1 glycerate kinase [Alkalibacterium gilvum]